MLFLPGIYRRTRAGSVGFLSCSPLPLLPLILKILLLRMLLLLLLSGFPFLRDAHSPSPLLPPLPIAPELPASVAAAEKARDRRSARALSPSGLAAAEAAAAAAAVPVSATAIFSRCSRARGRSPRSGSAGSTATAGGGGRSPPSAPDLASPVETAGFAAVAVAGDDADALRSTPVSHEEEATGGFLPAKVSCNRFTLTPGAASRPVSRGSSPPHGAKAGTPARRSVFELRCPLPPPPSSESDLMSPVSFFWKPFAERFLSHSCHRRRLPRLSRTLMLYPPSWCGGFRVRQRF